MSRRLYFMALVVMLIGYQLMPGRASSHREAPLISGDPLADNTDVYAFVSPDAPDTVTLIASFVPFEDPAGGPNFYRFGDNVLYELKIDNNGDGAEDITYQFRFTSQTVNPNTFLYATGPIKSLDDPNRNLFQTYTVTRVEGARTAFTAGPMRTMYDNVGPASTPNYGGNGSGIYEFTQADGTRGRVFAGQTDDAFFLDLRIFDFLYGGNLSEVGTDSLAGFNVHSIAIQVPRSSLRRRRAQSSASGRPRAVLRRRPVRPAQKPRTGSMVQVSRLGMPLVNEVVIPLGQKDRWNGSNPTQDAQFLSYVTDPEVPKLLQAVYGLTAPSTPRNDLVQVFLTGVPNLNQPPGVRPGEMIRLNTDIAPTATPSRLGVLASDIPGFPNGRRLTDDVIDITLQAAAGILTGARVSTLGDSVDRNDVPFRSDVPVSRPAALGRQSVEAEPESAVRQLDRVMRWILQPRRGAKHLVPVAIIAAVAAVVVYANVREARRSRQPYTAAPPIGTPGAPPTSREGLDRRVADMDARLAAHPEDAGAALLLADALLRQTRVTGNQGSPSAPNRC